VSAAAPARTEALLAALQALVGADNVLTAPEEREYHSMDAFWSGPVAAAVVRPGSRGELAEVVRAAAAAGHAVVARGGGMSYTAGYVPERASTVIVDTRRLDRILDVSDEDMLVTVEAGCTWKRLYEELAGRGLRTPYFGPLSGMFATVGGTLSNNSMFLGSGLYGTAADNVLGLAVVLADGRVLETGSRANRGGRAFHRYFGPDLTGLFLSDAGALGIKAEATLRLLRAPGAAGFASFAFDSFEEMFAAQAELARLRIAAECFGFDPFLNEKLQEVKGGFGEAAETLRDVARAGSSLAAGLKDAASVALAGRGFLSGVAWSLHVSVDGRDETSVGRDLDRVRRVARGRGREIEATVPRVIRANPFKHVGEFLVGHEGERWVPIHACLPLSKVPEAFAATRAYLEERREVLERFGIRTSYLTAVAGTDFILEPAFYYPDALTAFHLRNLLPEDARRFAARPHVPGANEAVVELLRGLARLYLERGAAHQQIGKFYPYLEGLAPVTRDVVTQVKRILDPKGLMNPGSLGLR
jgi:D-lactate dehydrogenase (cytochrome)